MTSFVRPCYVEVCAGLQHTVAGCGEAERAFRGMLRRALGSCGFAATRPQEPAERQQRRQTSPVSLTAIPQAGIPANA